MNRNQPRNAANEVEVDCCSCKESVFYKSISPYLDRFGNWYVKLYYEIFFFEKKGLDYFTIWVETYHPSLNLREWKDYKNAYKEQYMRIDDHNIILITGINDSLPTGFLEDCSKCFLSNDSIPGTNEVVEWDTTCYPLTFRHESVDGKYKIESVGMIIDFFSDNMIRYENLLREVGLVTEPYF